MRRKWHRFPVQNQKGREEKIKWRYVSDHPERFPGDFEERCRVLRDRDYPLELVFNGCFWQLREWVGFEGLCMMMVTDPEFVDEMAAFWTEFVMRTLEPILERVELGRSNPYVGAEYNTDGVELDVPLLGAITFVEDDPIIGVDVIGSACVPPGYVQLFAEAVEWKCPRTGVKMKVDGLWGEHLRWNLFAAGIDEGWRTAGLSSASLCLPDSKKVTIMAGSSHDIAGLDIKNMRHDAHYCIRIIRVTVKRPVK